VTWRVTLALVALVVLAGCAAPVSGPERPDPAFDRLGWEDGYWYNDPLDVTTDDGLNASEREAVVARTMARVEEIRGLEFKRSVSVEVMSREQYLERRGNGSGRNRAYEQWNNQVWEALLLVGENRNVSDAFGSTLSTTVQGYYSGGDIVIVSDSPTPSIDRGTLAHELVHALQDQHYSLGGNPQFQDVQLAHDGVIEGDANYVQRLYEQRCGDRWRCIPKPERAGGGGTGGQFNRGVFLTIFTPYAAGPTFVESVHEQRGWRGVNTLYSQFPESTEQVIHPEAYPDERPVDVSVRDRSNARWDRFDLNRPAHDVVGEASIYAMFWANGAVERGTRSPYQYEHPLSAGWAGDRVVPYRNGDRFGYVWVTSWDTDRDARQFLRAYREILANRSVRQSGGNVYFLPESDPFGDAFRVTRRGQRVRIVNGPTVAALGGIHDTE
jgi:hypothetical protein